MNSVPWASETVCTRTRKLDLTVPQSTSKTQVGSRTYRPIWINSQQQSLSMSSKTTGTTTPQRIRATAPIYTLNITPKNTLTRTSLRSLNPTKERAWNRTTQRTRKKTLRRTQVHGHFRMYPVRSVYIPTCLRVLYMYTGCYRGSKINLLKTFLFFQRSYLLVKSNSSHILLISLK